MSRTTFLIGAGISLYAYIGMVMDVADYIPLLGTNVSINGLKRGVSDTGGMIIPLPEAQLLK